MAEATKKIKEGEVNLDNPDVTSKAKSFDEPVRRILLKTDEAVRVAFLTEAVIMRYRHYKKGVGYRRCLSHLGWCPICASDLTPKEKRQSEAYGTNVFVFKTESTQDDVTQCVEPISGKNHLFIFGADKFIQLRSLKKMNKTLIGIDLQIQCTDDQFQKYAIIAYPRDSSMSSNAKVREYMLKKFEEGKYPVEKMICKEVSAKTLVREWGLDPSILESEEAQTILALAEHQDIEKREFEAANKGKDKPQEQAQKPKEVKPKVKDEDSVSLGEEETPEDETPEPEVKAPVKAPVKPAAKVPVKPAASVLDEL